MGCTQSKANEPKDPTKNDVDKQNSNEGGKELLSGSSQSIERPTNNRKQLDVQPPPVKAVPKVAPKAIPKKGN
ncbi:conserved Plasmodium protein, unknown function [Plasmodium ovale]|uniref:Uncharacterized protein n=1 Tax=Plasmodium ovale TaxID=36330 RepID=A0A1D3U7L1_PLAOA|nr:conserved Plasmodium protein, unknown function [Plasmodium ovale]